MIFFQEDMKTESSLYNWTEVSYNIRSAVFGDLPNRIKIWSLKRIGAQVKESLETEVKLRFYSLHRCFIMQKNDFSS